MPSTTSKSKNSFGIPFFTQGPAVLITRLNQILAALDSLRPAESADISPQVTAAGTLYRLRSPQGLTSRTRTPLVPFTLYDASTTSGGTTTLKLGVIPGTVNSVMPTLGGTALDNATPPTLTITATRHLWLKCTGTFGTSDSYVVTVEDSATNAVPSGTTITGTGFVSFVYLGSATVSGGLITVIRPESNGYNLSVESYGSVNYWWRSP